MLDRFRAGAAIAVPVVALAVIVIGLWPRPEVVTDPEARAQALAENLKCPFCTGESLAESQSGIAADYRILIAQRIAAGRTDAEIYAEFETNFGEQIRLDPPGTGWGVALWAAPLVVAVAGVFAIVSLRRSSRSQPMPAEDVP